MKNHRSMSGLQFIISVAILMALLMSKAEARLVVIDEWVTNDTLEETATFNIQFNEPFKYSVADEYSRQEMEFQYYIDTDNSSPPIAQDTAKVILRSAEMYISGEMQVVDATIVGWPQYDSIFPTVNGTEVTFTVPWAALRTVDGKFSYDLLIIEYGGTTDEAFGYPNTIGICHGEPVNIIIEVPIDPAPVDPVSSEPIVINVGPDTDPNPDVQNRTIKINGGSGAGWFLPLLLLLYLGANINRYYRNNRTNQV